MRRRQSLAESGIMMEATKLAATNFRGASTQRRQLLDLARRALR